MLKILIHAHGFTTSTYTPMECLNIDFIGAFPDQGYILVIVDTFTCWVELYHTTDATSLSAAECLLQHFGRFGACQFWSIEMDSVYMTQYGELIRYILVNILSASQSYYYDIDERESLRYHYQHQV